jgi:hypothetical protein
VYSKYQNNRAGGNLLISALVPDLSRAKRRVYLWQIPRSAKAPPKRSGEGLWRSELLCGSLIRNLANGYDEAMLNLGRINLTGARAAWESYAYAAGGVSSSVQANAVFFHTLFNGEWLDPETVAQMIDTIVAPD